MNFKLFIKSYAVLFILSIYSVFADTPFRLMTYNGLNVEGSTIGSRTAYFQTVIQAVNPDILLMQEIKDASGCDSILGRLNGSGNQYARVSLITGPDTYSMLFYRTSKVMFISQDTIATALRAINEYVVSIGGNTLRLYSCHLKSSTGTTNVNMRLAEVTALRVHLSALAPGSEFIIVGDMNLYTNTEPAYIKFMASEANNIGRAQDLSSVVGNWHDNDSVGYVTVHTQSTRITSFGGGASAGLDDRFDFILSNYGMNNNAGIEYVSNTYTVFGNDGNHFDDSINHLPNTAVSPTIANALYYASDHLPVYADFISKSTTAIDQNPVSSNGFILHQNYPNPFNPTTTITYDLPVSGLVSLKILNTMGQEVKSLVNGNETAGVKSVIWDGRNNQNMPVASGIYLYKLQVGEFHSTKKLLLLK